MRIRSQVDCEIYLEFAVRIRSLLKIFATWLCQTRQVLPFRGGGILGFPAATPRVPTNDYFASAPGLRSWSGSANSPLCTLANTCNRPAWTWLTSPSRVQDFSTTTLSGRCGRTRWVRELPSDGGYTHRSVCRPEMKKQF